MKKYHIRRSEREMNKFEIREIVQKGKYMTLALCKTGEPYLVTVNYAYDENERCFYFHCAAEGKKIEFIRANKRAWGQILEDLGYAQGECDHHYKTVHFQGEAFVLEDREAKRRALALMIDQLEEIPGPVKDRNLIDAKIDGVTIVKVTTSYFTGKKNLNG